MFDNTSKIILRLFGLVVLILIFTEILKPEPVNWDLSYTSYDKIPYGTYILYEELPTLTENSVQRVNSDPFVHLSENSDRFSNYIFINHSIYFDDRQSEKILDFVRSGGTVFIAAREVGGNFTDSLQLSVKYEKSVLQKNVFLNLYNQNLASSEPINFKNHYLSYFDSLPVSKTTALGYYEQESDQTKRINFISRTYGSGKFLIHLEPLAFTNNFLLNEDQEYVSSVLSYLPDAPILWDEYLKIGRKFVDSPMRFVLREDALRWSYYTLAIALILFLLFKSKRLQKIIPIVEVPRNSSIAFTEVIGSLYYQQQNFSNIIAKQISYFLEKVRSKFYLDTQELTSDFIDKLSLKSGNKKETTKELIELIIHLKGQPLHSEEDLIRLNKKLEEFKI